MEHPEEVTDFDLKDVRELNSASMSYINHLSQEELARRMDEITFPSFGDESTVTHAQDTLREYGIVVFPASINLDTCESARVAIESLYDHYAQAQQPVVEDDDVLFQIGSAKLKGFYKLANYGKTVVTVRQGQDQGMVDIFNCDIALRTDLLPFRTLFEHDYLLHVIGSNQLRPCNLNVYINSEITSTRGFHVDSYAEHLKAFVYLTDVTTLDDGPYTYVKKSHVDSPFQRANKSLCSDLTPATESPIVDPLAITPILAPRGSLVISDQAGVHRGWPQTIGHKRMAAVMKYAA